MHVVTSEILQNFGQTKLFLDVAITTSISIRIIILPVVKTWYYQAHSPHMVYLPSNYNTREVPKWTPYKLVLQNKGFKENPGGKEDPCTRVDCEEDHFWKSVCFKNGT